MKDVKESRKKLKTFSQHILEECEEEGFSIKEVKYLSTIFSQEVDKQIEELHDLKFNFKRI